MVKRWIEKCYVGLVLFLLYAPIAILIVCSFNASKSRRVWGGFTFQWYIELFQDEAVIEAVRTSLMLTTAAGSCSCAPWNAGQYWDHGHGTEKAAGVYDG